MQNYVLFHQSVDCLKQVSQVTAFSVIKFFFVRGKYHFDTSACFLFLTLFIILLQWISNFYLCFCGEKFVAFSCLVPQQQQNHLEGLFPGSKNMFIFAA